MKLLCVNNKPLPGTYNIPHVLAAIKEGETYEGYQVCTVLPGGKGSTGWRIPSISMNLCYNLIRFIPCSDLDETTLVNEEWEEKVCVPVNK